jgi:hypothetical protein
VTTGNPRGAFDPREPEHVARAIAELELSYVVLTMVDRDDLIDGGAGQVALTVTALRERCPGLLVETLAPAGAVPRCQVEWGRVFRLGQNYLPGENIVSPGSIQLGVGLSDAIELRDR